MSYPIQLIEPAEKDRLFDRCESRLLFSRKANIYGCCIKLLTEIDVMRHLWDDNFYTMSEDVRSHGRLVVLEEPSEPMSVRYDPYTKTAFLVNVEYYGWVKSIALAVAGDVLEDEHRIYSVHGAAIDLEGTGVTIIAPPNTGKTTHAWGLLRMSNARLVSDDWYFVRLSAREPLAFGSEKNCYVEGDIAGIWSEYEGLVKKAQVNRAGRALPNVRWTVGWGGVITMTTIRKCVLLKRDPHDDELHRELSRDEALEYLVKHDFCNPHQLVRDERKHALRKSFFGRYLADMEIHLVNTTPPPHETQETIRQILA